MCEVLRTMPLMNEVSVREQTVRFGIRGPI